QRLTDDVHDGGRYRAGVERWGACFIPLLAPEDEVGDAAGAGHGVAVESVEQIVRRTPEAHAAAELDRRDGDVERVDQVGIEELADDRGSAAETHVLAVGSLLRLSPRFLGGCVMAVERDVRQRDGWADVG